MTFSGSRSSTLVHTAAAPAHSACFKHICASFSWQESRSAAASASRPSGALSSPSTRSAASWYLVRVRVRVRVRARARARATATATATATARLELGRRGHSICVEASRPEATFGQPALQHAPPVPEQAQPGLQPRPASANWQMCSGRPAPLAFALHVAWHQPCASAKWPAWKAAVPLAL